MDADKPVVSLEALLEWIRCPMKASFRSRRTEPVFAYESLLRTMLLNTLKACYRESRVQDLENHTGDIWEYLLRKFRFPDPPGLIRKMNSFCWMRNRCLEQIDQKYRDSSGLLNTAHWWDAGLVFDGSYYRLRDEINENQGLLGFPDWPMVKAYFRENEYYPSSLADTFCDYINGIRLFELRKLPRKGIRFDVPAVLPLADIRLSVRFDILWKRERVYRAVDRDLKPGLIAEQLVPHSVFGNADRIRREWQILRDLRLPLIGADYTDEEGNAIRIDAVSCCTFPLHTGITAWKESDGAYDREMLSRIFARMNRYGLALLEAERKELYIPAGLVKNGICASCSFLKDCFMAERETLWEGENKE